MAAWLNVSQPLVVRLKCSFYSKALALQKPRKNLPTLKKEFTHFASIGKFGDALSNTHIEISVPLFLPRVQEGQD